MSRENSKLISISPKKRYIKLADKEISNIDCPSQYARSCLFTQNLKTRDEDEQNLFDELSRMPDFSMIEETSSFFEF
jgi:hypothetical protein